MVKDKVSSVESKKRKTIEGDNSSIPKKKKKHEPIKLTKEEEIAILRHRVKILEKKLDKSKLEIDKPKDIKPRPYKKNPKKTDVSHLCTLD